MASRKSIGCGFVASTLLLFAGVAGAQTSEACGVVQVGQAASSLQDWVDRPPVAVSADGSTVAYVDPGGPAVVVRDLDTGAERRVATPPHPATRPRLLSDGRRVTFVSRADIGGTNPQNELRTYVHGLRSGSTSPLQSPAADGLLSGNGRRIAYVSAGDVAGGNPEGNPKVFLHDRQTGTTIQLTSTVDGTPSLLATSRSSRTVAFAEADDDDYNVMDLAIATHCG